MAHPVPDFTRTVLFMFLFTCFNRKSLPNQFKQLKRLNYSIVLNCLVVLNRKP